jgi:hypothetical protein
MSMRAMSVDVVRIPTKGPGDVSGLIRLIETGKIIPSSILAVLGKTEGNGGVNDFTREYAMAALCNALSPHLGLTPRQSKTRSPLSCRAAPKGCYRRTLLCSRAALPPTPRMAAEARSG